MDEMEINPVHGHGELPQSVEPCLVSAPVVLPAPVRCERLHVLEIAAVLPIPARVLVGPPCTSEPHLQIGECFVGEVDRERPWFRHRFSSSRLGAFVGRCAPHNILRLTRVLWFPREGEPLLAYDLRAAVREPRCEASPERGVPSRSQGFRKGRCVPVKPESSCYAERPASGTARAG